MNLEGLRLATGFSASDMVHVIVVGVPKSCGTPVILRAKHKRPLRTKWPPAFLRDPKRRRFSIPLDLVGGLESS